MLSSQGTREKPCPGLPRASASAKWPRERGRVSVEPERREARACLVRSHSASVRGFLRGALPNAYVHCALQTEPVETSSWTTDEEGTNAQDHSIAARARRSRSSRPRRVAAVYSAGGVSTTTATFTTTSGRCGTRSVHRAGDGNAFVITKRTYIGEDRLRRPERRARRPGPIDATTRLQRDRRAWAGSGLVPDQRRRPRLARPLPGHARRERQLDGFLDGHASTAGWRCVFGNVSAHVRRRDTGFAARTASSGTAHRRCPP